MRPHERLQGPLRIRPPFGPCTVITFQPSLVTKRRSRALLQAETIATPMQYALANVTIEYGNVYACAPTPAPTPVSTQAPPHVPTAVRRRRLCCS